MNRKRSISLFLFLCIFCLMLTTVSPAYAIEGTSYTYTISADYVQYLPTMDAYLPAGTYLTEIGLKNPEDMFLHGRDLYIADTGNRRIVVYSLDTGEIRTFGEKDLRKPTGISVAENIGDRLVNDVAPKDRDIAMVFQNYALYPHMTVYDNMAFGLKLHHMPKAEIDKKVREAADILDIKDYLGRKPKALSGGQRQRVAIGRAIVRDPQVMLMDEPLSNLDAKLRNQMRAELIKLRQKINTTFIYVTHDQTEAMTLGDRIVIMKDGFIQQIGTPQEVFNHPYNLFVAGFIGTPQMNFFNDAKLVIVNGKYAVSVGGMTVELSPAKQEKLAANNVVEQDVVLGVRPEHIVLEAGLKGAVDVSELMGSSVHLHVTAMDRDVVMVVSTMNMTGAEVDALTNGAAVQFNFPGHCCHVFNKDTGINLEA